MRMYLNVNLSLFLLCFHFSQCVIVVVCDCLTGIFAGFTVFATIGFVAVKLKGGDITRAAVGGPGLAFVIYPEAISQMPDSSVFAVFFFLMLITIGLGSEVSKRPEMCSFSCQSLCMSFSKFLVWWS